MGKIFALAFIIFSYCILISDVSCSGFCLIFISTLSHLSFKGKFDLYVRGLKCFNIDPEYFEKVICKLKAVRGKKGVIYGSGTVKKLVEHPWVIFLNFSCILLY